MKLEDKIETEKKSLAIFVDKARYMNNLADNWPNLHFTEAGKMRLANIAGFIHAFHISGNEDLIKFATKMAVDLNSILTGLNGYGGEDDREITHCGERYSVKAPNYRIIVSDDASLHNFSILWCAKVTAERYDVYKCMGELKLIRHVPGTFNDSQKMTRAIWVDVNYMASFNGGLIYHGPANEAHSVKIGSDDKLWATHT